MADPILLRNDNLSVSTLTLNTPRKLNALSSAMIQTLQTELENIASSSEFKVVIINAVGRAFCAGHDLAELRTARGQPDKGATALKSLFDQCAHLMQTIQTLPQPVIASVQGLATAAGCQLVATCDLAIAADEANFGVNGVNIGLFCSTPMVALTRNIPRKSAFELLTTGRFMSAAEAESLGLVNRCVSLPDLAEETELLAKTIAEKQASVIKIGKRAFYEQLEMETAAAYAHTGDVMVKNMAFDETAEGIAAFLEKRPPNWNT